LAYSKAFLKKKKTAINAPLRKCSYVTLCTYPFFICLFVLFCFLLLFYFYHFYYYKSQATTLRFKAVISKWHMDRNRLILALFVKSRVQSPLVQRGLSSNIILEDKLWPVLKQVLN
jgi:hypothetical protein